MFNDAPPMVTPERRIPVLPPQVSYNSAKNNNNAGLLFAKAHLLARRSAQRAEWRTRGRM